MRVVFLLFLFLSFSFAHKVNLFITNDTNKVDIYSYFANGNPCINCNVIVKSAGKTLFEDKLNSEGKYFFEAKNKNLEIIIDAGSGHIAKKELNIDEKHLTSVKKQMEQEEKSEIKNILISLFLIFAIFYILKRFKKR